MSSPERAHSRGPARIGLAALLAITFVAAIGASGTPAPRRLHPYPVHLPRGAGATIAGRACLLCHSAMLLAQQHKDSTAWEKTLGTMQKWGAPLTPAERDTLRGYLVTRFGPRRLIAP